MSLTETTKSENGLRRTEIRAVLKRHKGAIAEVARSLDPPVTTTSVSMALRGKGTSARIMSACEAKARELLAEEGTRAA